MSLLRIGPLSAVFGNRRLYSKISLEFKENDFFLLTGPSGVGKTTLLRQAVGLHPAPRVSRRLRDREFSPEELPAFRKHCLFLPAGAPLLPGSIEENLRFPFALKMANKRFPREEAQALLKALGLGHLSLTQEAKALSLGERHRLALTRALLWDPEIILADEPFTGLDERAQILVARLLLEFVRRPGKALLVVSHGFYPPGVTCHLHLENGRLEVKK